MLKPVRGPSHSCVKCDILRKQAINGEQSETSQNQAMLEERVEETKTPVKTVTNCTK